MAFPHTRSPADVRVLHAGVIASLFCAGLYVTALGPALPFIARDLGISLGQAGLLLTLLFGGSITASGAVAASLHGRDQRAVVLAGLTLVMAGLMVVGVAPVPELALLGALVLGLGDGLVTGSSHGIVASTAEDVPRAINRLNLFFALGAILGPLWSGIALEVTGERAVVFGGTAVVAGVAAAAMLVAPLVPPRSGRGLENARMPANLLVWALSLVLFLYVGAEMGLGAWVSSYVREAAAAGVMTGAGVTSAYWGALALGRLTTGALLARGRGADGLLLASIAGAGIASAILALSDGHLALGVPAAFVTGLCFGPVWPVAVAIGASGSRSSAPALMVTVGNAGGVLFPWTQGVVLSSVGATEGIAMTAVLCGVMLAVAGVALRARQ